MSDVTQNGKATGPAELRRKEWVKPELKVMAAGSAELAVGAIDDGADQS